jgi:UDP-glucuronate 4-epimerase
MRALVTGAAGFIASNLVDRLLAEGWEVLGLDDFDPYYDPEQKRRNLRRALACGSFELVQGDVRDLALVSECFDRSRPDVVVHLAARAGVRASVLEPVPYVQVNELGGLHVLDCCHRRGGIPLVFASTSSVYGATSAVPFSELEPAVEPLSPYAASKRAAELMVQAYWHLHHQPTAVLRFFTVYGPRGRPDMAFAGFTRALLGGSPIRLHGAATARDFTYVSDITAGVVGAIHWVMCTRQHGTFNLGRSEPVLVTSLIELLGAALQMKPQVVLGELQPGESPITAADISRAAAAFGYRPEVSLAEGVDRWVDWLRTDEAPPDLRLPAL